MVVAGLWELSLILIVIPFHLVVDMPGESVQFGRMPAGLVGKRVIEAGQIEGPLGLATIQGLSRSKVREVSVVV